MSAANQLGLYVTVIAAVPATLAPGTRVVLASTAGTPAELKPASNAQIGLGVVPEGVGINTSPSAITILVKTPGTRAGIFSGSTATATGAVLYAGNNGTVQGAPDSGAGTMVGVSQEQVAVTGPVPVQFSFESAV